MPGENYFAKKIRPGKGRVCTCSFAFVIGLPAILRGDGKKEKFVPGLIKKHPPANPCYDPSSPCYNGGS